MIIKDLNKFFAVVAMAKSFSKKYGNKGRAFNYVQTTKIVSI